MKKIILLFSFVFMSSCVTANTKSRDLSGVNPEPEMSSVDTQFKTCVSDCTAKGGLSFLCSDSCLKTVKVKQEKPLMLADDYDTCVKGCIGDGGGFWECHRVCEE